MVKHFTCVMAGLMVFSLANQAFGWGGPSHSAMATKLMDDPVIAPLIPASVSVSTVKNFTGEPPDAWHHPNWSMISTRSYLTNFQGDNWPGLDATTRVKYLIHMATDDGVPINHSPARSVYCEGFGLEEAIEAQVATWSTYPTITGTSSYTHNENGYSTTFNGTYAEVVNKFYYACRDNASWFKSKEKSFLGVPYHTSEVRKDAGWNGTTLGMYLGRAMLADLFLAEQDTIANANGSYAVNPGGSIAFSSAGSSDPDSITWNGSGSYSNNGGGFNCAWDMNDDGTYETAGASPNLSHAALVGLVGYTEGKTIRLRVADTEPGVYQSTTTDTATIAVYSKPTADALAQYALEPGASIAFSATGDDADGGSVTFEWDLDGDGHYDDLDGTGSLTYDQLFAMGLDVGKWLTITLKVEDNEGQITYDEAKLALYPSILGDANGDGVVDVTDYTSWANNFGTGDDWSEGDFDLDGMITSTDYVIWANHYGATMTGPPGAVPEPTTLSLLGLGVLAILRRRKM